MEKGERSFFFFLPELYISAKHLQLPSDCQMWNKAKCFFVTFGHVSRARKLCFWALSADMFALEGVKEQGSLSAASVIAPEWCMSCRKPRGEVIWGKESKMLTKPKRPLLKMEDTSGLFKASLRVCAHLICLLFFRMNQQDLVVEQGDGLWVTISLGSISCQAFHAFIYDLQSNFTA